MHFNHVPIGEGHNINSSNFQNSSLCRDGSEGDPDKNSSSKDVDRNYERLMIDNDKMKPHSMFVKGVRFGGLKPATETRFD